MHVVNTSEPSMRHSSTSLFCLARTPSRHTPTHASTFVLTCFSTRDNVSCPRICDIGCVLVLVDGRTHWCVAVGDVLWSQSQWFPSS